MIQRIQSIYLLLTTFLSLLFLNGNIFRFINNSGSVINLTLHGIFHQNTVQGQVLNEKLIPFSVLLILVPAISFLTIFIFKSRKIQLLLTKILITLVGMLIIVSGYYSYNIIRTEGMHFVFGYKVIIPVIILIFSCLAHRGIKKDDLLVRSYDSLR